MFRFEQLTQKNQEAVQMALSLAVEANHSQIEGAHLLKASLEVEGSLFPVMLNKLNVNVASVQELIHQALQRLPQVEGSNQQPTLSSSAHQVLNHAAKLAKSMKDEYVSQEHWFLAFFERDSDGFGGLLKRNGLTRADIDTLIQQLRGGQHVQDQSAEGKYQALERYARDLTAEAEAGNMDPVIGRDDEIRRTIQVLSRRTKNNPVLIGDPVSEKQL
jgi:ATP-dependent Clp protease ATP-binding subunit ClpB